MTWVVCPILAVHLVAVEELQDLYLATPNHLWVELFPLLIRWAWVKTLEPGQALLVLNRRQDGLIRATTEELEEVTMALKKVGAAEEVAFHRRMLDRYRISFPSLNRENHGKAHRSRQRKTTPRSLLAHYTRLASQMIQTFTQTVARKQGDPTRQLKLHLHQSAGEDPVVAVTRASLLWVSPIQLGLSIRLRRPAPFRPLVRLLTAQQ